MGTLAGNLIMKHNHNDFPSDVYIVFEALNAQVVLQESVVKEKAVTMAKFLKTEMNGKIIRAIILRPYLREQYIFDSYKVNIYPLHYIIFIYNQSLYNLISDRL